MSPERLRIPTRRAATEPAGRPLDAATRAGMERRLGHDFSRVRVHTDARAADATAALRADAFTVGEQITFAPGRFAPGTADGHRLLGHELAHVVQQRPGRDAPSADPARAEREADAAARGHRPSLSRRPAPPPAARPGDARRRDHQGRARPAAQGHGRPRREAHGRRQGPADAGGAPGREARDPGARGRDRQALASNT